MDRLKLSAGSYRNFRVVLHMLFKFAVKRTRNQRQRDLVIIAELLLKEFTYDAIAAELARQFGYSLSRTQVFRDVKLIRQRWSEQAIETHQLVMSRRLSTIQLLKREAWAGWERSRLDAETRSATRTGEPGAGGAEIKQTVTKHGQVGDGSFLRLFNELDAEAAALQGCVPLQRHEVTGPDGAPIQPAVSGLQKTGYRQVCFWNEATGTNEVKWEPLTPRKRRKHQPPS